MNTTFLRHLDKPLHETHSTISLKDSVRTSSLLGYWTVLETTVDQIRFTSLLTYSLKQSPSWEADRFAANQEIPLILWNPKVYCCIHKWPPRVPILSQPNPVHTPTSHFLKIYFNVILPSTPASTKWPLSSRFPHQNPVCAFPIRYKERLIVARTFPVPHAGLNELEGYCVKIRPRKKCRRFHDEKISEGARQSPPPPVHPRKSCCRLLLVPSVENDVIIISNLSNDRSKASSKTIPPRSAI